MAQEKRGNEPEKRGYTPPPLPPKASGGSQGGNQPSGKKPGSDGTGSDGNGG